MIKIKNTPFNIITSIKNKSDYEDVIKNLANVMISKLNADPKFNLVEMDYDTLTTYMYNNLLRPIIEESVFLKDPSFHQAIALHSPNSEEYRRFSLDIVIGRTLIEKGLPEIYKISAQNSLHCDLADYMDELFFKIYN